MKVMKDSDYIEIYAETLKDNNKFFNQQKKLIESQFHSSTDIFRKRFGTGEDFKRNARKYLKSVGML